MIRSLKANVTQEDALRYFTRGARGVAAAVLHGSARSMAELYIPYRLFRVSILNRGREENRVYALDAIEGTLDLFEFHEMPGERELTPIETRNALPYQLSAEQARERVLAQVRRMIFSRGFLRLRGLQMEASESGEFYVPYWVCFRETRHGASLQILDAVRRRPEGAKVRELVERWLHSSTMRTPVKGDEREISATLS